jgi:hypothetical protein
MILKDCYKIKVVLCLLYNENHHNRKTVANFFFFGETTKNSFSFEAAFKLFFWVNRLLPPAK